MNAVGMWFVEVLNDEAWVKIFEAPGVLDKSRTGAYQFIPYFRDHTSGSPVCVLFDVFPHFYASEHVSSIDVFLALEPWPTARAVPFLDALFFFAT